MRPVFTFLNGTLTLLLFIWISCIPIKEKEYWPNGNLKSLERIKKVNGRSIYHGKSIHFYPNGKKKDISFWRNDSLVKFQKGWYENGKLMYIDLILGYSIIYDTINKDLGIVQYNLVVNYKTKRYYKNGLIALIGEYKALKKQNLWIYYDTAGKEINRSYFKGDTLINVIK